MTIKFSPHRGSFNFQGLSILLRDLSTCGFFPKFRSKFDIKKKKGIYYGLWFTVTVADACAEFPEASVA